MEPADLTGAVLDGRYRVIEPIAEGAMGVVYRAERLKLGRVVAIKVLHDELPAELSSRKRFEIEAMAMAKLEHPHCAQVIDVGVHGDKPFVVMDFVSGQNLKDVIADGPLPRERAVEIVRQVLSGLAHAHDLGIIHRDIKPANIVLSQKAGLGDHVKILDFGLARFADNAASGITTGIVVGTPSYMAPEQIRGVAIDHRADIYACGILLFELLTGKKPFVSEKDDPIEVCTMHLKTKPPMLKDIQPGLDLEILEPIVARALDKKAEERYATAVEFAAALDVVPARRMATAPVVAQSGPTNVATETGWSVPAEAKASMLPGDVPSTSEPVSGRSVPIAGAIPMVPAPLNAQMAPTSAPVNASMTPTGTPVAAPTSAPMSAPNTAPTSAPNARTSTPLNAPIAAPMSAPNTAPTSTPVNAPIAAPMSAPNTAPTSTPLNAPIAAPSAPNTAPTSTPLNAPFTAPTSPVNAPMAPTNAPVAPTNAPMAPTSTPVNAPNTMLANAANAAIAPTPAAPAPAGLPADFDLSRVIPSSPTGANEKGLSPGFDLSLAIPQAPAEAPLERSAPQPTPPTTPVAPADQPTMAMPDLKSTIAFLGAPPAGPSPLAAPDVPALAAPEVPAVAEPVRLPEPPAQLPLSNQQLKKIGLGVIGGVVLIAIIASIAKCGGGGDPKSDTKEAITTPHDSADAGVTKLEPTAQSTADEQVTRAKEMLAAGKQDEALELLLAAKRIFPKDARFAYFAGKIHFAKQMWTIGLKEFREVLALDPTYRADPEMTKIVMKAFLKARDYSEDLATFLRTDIGPPAKPYFEDAARRHPNENARKRAASEAAKFK